MTDITLETLQTDLGASGRVAVMEERTEEAIPMLELAVELEPTDHVSLNWLGIALSRKGQTRRALECFSRAVQLDAANTEYRYNLALEALEAGEESATSPDMDRPFSSGLAEGTLRELSREFREAWQLREMSTGIAAQPGTVAKGPAPSIHSDLLRTNVKYPGVLTRVTAALMDVAVLQVIGLALVIVLNAFEQYIPDAPVIPNGIRIIVGALVAFVYVVGLTRRRGQTLGKSLLRLRVVGKGGSQPTLKQVLCRTAAMPLDLATGGIGFIWMQFDGQHQALHDKVGSTWVVGRVLEPSSAVIWITGLFAANYYLYYILSLQLFG